MEPKICLDTDVIIRILQNKTDTISVLEKLEDSHELCTTILNISELYYGAYRKSIQEVRALEFFIARLRILEPTQLTAIKTAQIRAKLTKQGLMTDMIDVMIATLALENNCKIFTHNKNHFERIPGIELI